LTGCEPCVLEMQGLGKRYRLFASPLHRLAVLLGWRDRSTAHWALQDISFELRRGECIGVIGNNGAGKSTLLKLLAGTLQPTTGRLHLKGRVTAILELGAGFHPDFSGRDNLMFAGSFMGISQESLARLAPSIIDFSELHDAIDRPVKTYSSGMVVRLAFALVTAVQPEVLIIDEALAVGDQHFQRKCIARIQQFREAGCTILFCSHSMYHIRQLCGRVLWLADGRLKAMGETEQVLAAYDMSLRQLDEPSVHPGIEPAPDTTCRPAIQPMGERLAALVSAELQDAVPDSSSEGCFRLNGRDLTVELHAQTRDAQPPSFGVMIEQLKGIGITSVATHADGAMPIHVGTQGGFNTWRIQLTFTDLPLHSGKYSLSFYLFDAAGLIVYDEWKDHRVIEWVSHSLTPGLVKLPHQWV
jgi:lipopolysaccharide transport system ATP-binding protein